MKALFLDVDGVLNSLTWLSNPDAKPVSVDPVAVALLQTIVDATDCKLVWSSSWRNDCREHWIDFENNYLKPNGCDAPIYSVTPYIRPPATRGHEIERWLSVYREVTRYAIVDDDNNMLKDQKRNLFQTTYTHGLTHEIAQAIIEHLNSE